MGYAYHGGAACGPKDKREKKLRIREGEDWGDIDESYD